MSIQYFCQRNGKEWLITILCKNTQGPTSWISYVNINSVIKIVLHDRQFHIWASENMKILHQNALTPKIDYGWFFLAKVFPSSWIRHNICIYKKNQPLIILFVPSFSLSLEFYSLSLPLKAILLLFLILYPTIKWKYKKHKNILQKFKFSYILFQVI